MTDLGLQKIKKGFLLTLIMMSILMMSGLSAATVIEETAPFELIVNGQTAKANSSFVPLVGFNLVANESETLSSVSFTLIDAGATGLVNADVQRASIFYSSDEVFDSGDTEIGSTGTANINIGSPTSVTTNYLIPSSGTGMHFFIAIKTSSSWAEPNALRINLAEGTSTFLLGTGQGTVDSTLLIGQNNLTADATLPSITSAVTMDFDADGYIDGYKLTFDGPIVDSTLTDYVDTTTPFATTVFAVSGYSNVMIDPNGPNNNDAANNNILYLTFTESDSYDTDATPALTVTGSTLEDYAGNVLADVLAAAEIESDGAAPVIVGQIYTDSGNDGTIDQVVLTFSEPISYAEYDDNDWAVTANDLTGLDVTAGTAELNETLTLTASADAGKTGGITQPTLAYSGDGVVDAANNELAADTVTLADETTPIVISRVTGDSDSDGQIDMITLTFSEALNSSVLGIFAVDVTGYAGESYYDTDNTDNVIAVNFTESGSPDTAATPDVQITNAGSVTDRATTPNPLVAEGSATASTDGAAPVAISRVTGDNGRNGQIDRIVLTFSENVTNFVSASVDGYTADGGNWGEATANISTIFLVESGSPDTDATPVVRITNTLSADDSSDNVVAVEDTGVSATDGAAPALLAAVAGDGTSDLDGKDADDTVVLTFSENTTEFEITALNINTVLALDNEHSWLDGGNEIGSANWTSPSVLTVTLSVTDSVPTVAVGDVITPSSSITDGTNAMGTDTATITGSFDDVTAPTMLSATTDDADANGYIDTMVLVFDESMNGSINSTTGLAIGSFEFNATGVWSQTTVANDTLTIALNESESYDTGAKPDVTYNATLGSLADASLANNVLEDIGTDDITEVDGASPVIVGQEYRDINSDGTVDRVVLSFSEDIYYTFYEDGDWTVTANDITGLDVTEGTVSGSTTLNLTATANAGITGGSSQPTIAYNAANGDAVLQDIEHNTLASVTVTLTDSAAPAIYTATTRDSNGNGKLDNVTIVFTESVSDASLHAANFSIGGTAADTKATGDTENDNTVIFTISDDSSQSVDTDSANVVFTAGSYSDGTNSMTVNQTIASIDAAAPVITGQEYRDANGNGTVDQVVLTFSEPITYSSYEDVDWTVTANSITGLEVSAGTATNNATLVLTATANANITGGSEAPTIQYNVAGEVSITDGSNTLAGDTVTLADAAAPVVVSRTTGDADFDGYIDKVTLAFTEALTSSELGDFAVAVTGYDGESYYDADNTDNIIVVNITESGSYDTDATPEVQITNAGFVTDRAATLNAVVAEESATAATDGAAPAIISAVASDATIDGEGIDADDTVVLTFSENTTEAAINAGNINTVLALDNEHSWLDGGNAIGSAIWTSPSVLTVTLSVTEGVPTVVVGDIITPSASITDGTNAMGDSSVAITGNFNDVTAPTMLSATTNDADGNGYIDEIAVIFDESMKVSVVSTTGFTIGDYEINATGAWSQTTLANDTFTISLVESGSYDTNATPLVTYNETEGSLTDDASAANALEDVSMTAVDGAAPVVVSRLTADGAESWSKADRVVLTFSEALNSSELGAFAVEVAGYEGENYVDLDNADNVIVVTFTEGDSIDTDATPDVQITNAGSVTDRATSPIALAAEGSATAATDGIMPYLSVVDEGTTDDATIGDTVTIVFTTSEELVSNPVVKLSSDPGEPLIGEEYDATFVSLEGSNYTYNYEIQGTEAEDNYWILLNGTDLASNIGTDVSWYVTFDFAAPDQITGVTAADKQNSSGGLSVSWDTSGASDFAYYNIYVSTSEITDVSGMTPENTVNDVDTTTTNLWTIDGDAIVDGVDYYVAVAANDTIGNQNNTVVSFGPVKPFPDMTLSLEQGWNLVSVPGRLDNSSTEDVFGERYVFYYDAAAAQWDVSPDNIVPCRGYWVYSATVDSVNLQFEYMPVDGSVPKIPPTQDLVAGWNMIGHTSADNINVTTSLTSITGSYSNLLKYSGSAGWERYVNAELRDFTQMSAGEGYWIFMTENKTYAAIDNYYENPVA